MNEHRIRLRGGWGWRPTNSPESDDVKLTLPVRWRSRNPGRKILTRRFGRPRLEQGSRVLLQMDQVQGVVALWLNGQPIFPVLPEITRYEIELPDLAERNVLILELEVREPDGEITDSGGEWGMIALVVRTDE
jgi:hypothetical protein